MDKQVAEVSGLRSTKDRLADGWQMPPFHTVSSSLYRPHTVTVTAMLADMVAFFTKHFLY